MRIFFVFLIVLGALGCGHLQLPEYNSPLERFSPDGSRQPQNQDPQSPKVFQLVWPVDNVRITQKYNPKKRRRPHYGIDLGGKRHDPIYAAHEGTVIYAGSGFKGYGKMVIVQFDAEWATLYSHLHTIAVKEGQKVYPRQKLGGMGRTGRASGVHLHFELMQYKTPIDPLPMLESAARVVQN